MRGDPGEGPGPFTWSYSRRPQKANADDARRQAATSHDNQICGSSDCGRNDDVQPVNGPDGVTLRLCRSCRERYRRLQE